MSEQKRRGGRGGAGGKRDAASASSRQSARGVEGLLSAASNITPPSPEGPPKKKGRGRQTKSKNSPVLQPVSVPELATGGPPHLIYNPPSSSAASIAMMMNATASPSNFMLAMPRAQHYPSPAPSPVLSPAMSMAYSQAHAQVQAQARRAAEEELFMLQQQQQQQQQAIQQQAMQQQAMQQQAMQQQAMQQQAMQQQAIQQQAMQQQAMQQQAMQQQAIQQQAMQRRSTRERMQSAIFDTSAPAPVHARSGSFTIGAITSTPPTSTVSSGMPVLQVSPTMQPAVSAPQMEVQPSKNDLKSAPYSSDVLAEPTKGRNISGVSSAQSLQFLMTSNEPKKEPKPEAKKDQRKPPGVQHTVEVVFTSTDKPVATAHPSPSADATKSSQGTKKTGDIGSSKPEVETPQPEEKNAALFDIYWGSSMSLDVATGGSGRSSFSESGPTGNGIVASATAGTGESGLSARAARTKKRQMQKSVNSLLSDSHPDKLVPQAMVAILDHDDDTRRVVVENYVNNWLTIAATSSHMGSEINSIIAQWYPSSHKMLLDDVLVTFMLHRPEMSHFVMVPLIQRIFASPQMSHCSSSEPPLSSFLKLCSHCPDEETEKGKYADIYRRVCLREVVRVLFESNNSPDLKLTVWLGHCLSHSSPYLLEKALDKIFEEEKPVPVKRASVFSIASLTGDTSRGEKEKNSDPAFSTRVGGGVGPGSQSSSWLIANATTQVDALMAWASRRLEENKDKKIDAVSDEQSGEQRLLDNLSLRTIRRLVNPWRSDEWERRVSSLTSFFRYSSSSARCEALQLLLNTSGPETELGTDQAASSHPFARALLILDGICANVSSLSSSPSLAYVTGDILNALFASSTLQDKCWKLWAWACRHAQRVLFGNESYVAAYSSRIKYILRHVLTYSPENCRLVLQHWVESAWSSSSTDAPSDDEVGWPYRIAFLQASLSVLFDFSVPGLAGSDSPLSDTRKQNLPLLEPTISALIAGVNISSGGVDDMISKAKEYTRELFLLCLQYEGNAVTVNKAVTSFWVNVLEKSFETENEAKTASKAVCETLELLFRMCASSHSAQMTQYISTPTFSNISVTTAAASTPSAIAALAANGQGLSSLLHLLLKDRCSYTMTSQGQPTLALVSMRSSSLRLLECLTTACLVGEGIFTQRFLQALLASKSGSTLLKEILENDRSEGIARCVAALVNRYFTHLQQDKKTPEKGVQEHIKPLDIPPLIELMMELLPDNSVSAGSEQELEDEEDKQDHLWTSMCSLFDDTDGILLNYFFERLLSSAEIKGSRNPEKTIAVLSILLRQKPALLPVALDSTLEFFKRTLGSTRDVSIRKTDDLQSLTSVSSQSPPLSSQEEQDKANILLSVLDRILPLVELNDGDQKGKRNIETLMNLLLSSISRLGQSLHPLLLRTTQACLDLLEAAGADDIHPNCSSLSALANALRSEIFSFT